MYKSERSSTLNFFYLHEENFTLKITMYNSSRGSWRNCKKL